MAPSARFIFRRAHIHRSSWEISGYNSLSVLCDAGTEKGFVEEKKKMPKNISVILKAAAWCHIYPELHLFIKGPVYVNLIIFKENEHKLGLSVCITTLINKQTKHVFSHLKVRSWGKHGHGPPFCSWRCTVFPQGPKKSWLLDRQKQFSGKTFSLAVGILTTGHRQISHTGLSCQISGFVSAFKRDSFEPSISFWISENEKTRKIRGWISS